MLFQVVSKKLRNIQGTLQHSNYFKSDSIQTTSNGVAIKTKSLPLQKNCIMENYVEEKVALAVSYFKGGYNCAQSVFMAFADDFKLDKELAARFSASFGGGIGRMREVCGTVCGMAMCASFISPANNPADHNARTQNYALTQEFAEKFRMENGDIVCRRLLGLPDATKESPEPSQRTPEFYKKRPCVEYVACATRIVAEKILQY